jgi:hypothetical protein
MLRGVKKTVDPPACGAPGRVTLGQRMQCAHHRGILLEQRAPGVRSHCRLRTRGAEYVSKSVMK